MGYFKGLFTSLAIILPSFLFIHIYDNALTVVGFFQDLIGGNWLSLLDICETAIFEPINVFFIPIDGLRIFFAFIPWVVSAFVVSFFFRKKHWARAGLATVMILLFTAAAINMLVIRKEMLYTETFLEANILYGFLVSIGVLLVIGFASGAISPFKIDSEPKMKKIKKVKSLPTSPPSFIQDEQEPGSPFYMPQESPSRDNYIDRYHSPPSQTTRSSPTACEYCGSYVDADTEYCSICGNRVRSDY